MTDGHSENSHHHRHHQQSGGCQAWHIALGRHSESLRITFLLTDLTVHDSPAYLETILPFPGFLTSAGRHEHELATVVSAPLVSYLNGPCDRIPHVAVCFHLRHEHPTV